MFSLSRALAAGAVLFASVNAGDNFIISQVRPLSITRVDPLVTPGANGPHVHNVVGGSTFGPDSTTPESLENAKCTSGMVGDDKSIYWTPQVYYNQGNGSYTPILTSTRIYYFLKPLNGTKPVTAFPRGLRMLAGGQSDSRPATYPPRGELSYEQLQAMDPRIAAIKWGCSAGAVQGEGNGGSLPGQRPYLPNDAPNGCGVLNAGIFYPSCNDGRLDSPDHFSHMAYPLDGSNGYNCPASHPNKFPTMFLENFYFMNDNQKFRGANTDNWVLSNGDTLGLTMHADFINGWTPGSLESVLKECNAPNAPGENLSACAPLAKSLSVDNADNCRSEGNIVDEDVGLLQPINALPGCNSIWPADARTKPSCKTDQLPMVQPASRLTVPDLKIALPVAGGTSKVVAAPAGASNSQSYSYNYDSTSTYSSTSAYATSSAASTSSAAAAAAATSATSSSESAAAAATSATDAATSSSESGSSSSAAPTSSSYYDPNGYYGSEYGTSTTASASTSTSASSSSGTSATYSDPYGYVAPPNAQATAPAATSVSTSSASSSSSSSSASAAAAAAPASASSVAGAPAPGSATSSVNPAASSSSAPHVNSPPAHPKPFNPSASKAVTSSTSTPTPTPQKANVGHGRPPKKTCAHRKHPKSHARRRRDWNKQIID